MGRLTIFRILSAVYLAAVSFICFWNFGSLANVPATWLGIESDKVVHFLMFLPFVPLGCGCFELRSKGPVRAILAIVAAFATGCAFGGFTEFVQGFIPGRMADIDDFNADAAGLAAGAIISFFLLFFHRPVAKRNKALAIVAFLAAFVPAEGQGLPRASDFSEVCDTLTARCNRRFNVRSVVNLTKVFLRGGRLDFYFDKKLADYPWHEEDVSWFRSEFGAESGKALRGYDMASCIVLGLELEELATPIMTAGGKAPEFAATKHPIQHLPLVRRSHSLSFRRGLRGRHIALWQSHGLYYNEDQDLWKWQRATLHRTVEDMFTQAFVLQYLIPMLENAGAYVMTPRERDIQRYECVCDNDSSFEDERAGLLRRSGTYSESGLWEDAGVGFADALKEYAVTDNPFRMGTARRARCSVTPSSSAVWTPDIPERGEYAVYVSYKTVPGSCKSARYTVEHLGGSTEFLVDQSKGGGTWVYLGTFLFDRGCGDVSLDNKGKAGETVTADAVRFGGGMGKISRGGRTSGMPAYAEGASYWMPWAGVDSTLRAWDDDYTCDYATRGAWVKMMKKEKGIPFDCALAFHSDAGVTPNDSLVGTMAIYTLKAEGSRKFSDGFDRMTGRTLADFVQTQVVGDIRASVEPQWSRRPLWDRSYSESRTPDVPAVLLELLSHQNFADMKYGHDPSFRFIVGRAVYKALLKYLSGLYGFPYTVQPLPVHAFAAEFAPGGEVRLSWQPTADALEKTAAPKGYVVYTRVGDGDFDEGVTVQGCSAVMKPEPGQVCSYRVAAWNEGGLSFPSEVLSVGIPEGESGPPVLIVNNFDRVAAPAWIDTPLYAGFESRLDPGMPYVRDISYIGENYEFDRTLGWESDYMPGFGASYCDKAGMTVAGNTFDFPSVHGASLLRLGRPFCSVSAEAFEADTTLASRFQVLDLLCGAQLTTRTGRGAVSDRFSVFPEAMRNALSRWIGRGGAIFISGSRIGTDVWGKVYETAVDLTRQAQTREFVRKMLGYRLASSYGTNTAMLDGMPFYGELNPVHYAVLHPDGLEPSTMEGEVWMRYGGSGVPAGVKFSSDGHCVASLGLPLECLVNASDRDRVLRDALEFLESPE